MKTILFRAAGAALAIGLSSAAWAGGVGHGGHAGGMMVRPRGAVHMAGGHVVARTWGGSRGGVGGGAWGHGAPAMYGHVNTAQPNGYARGFAMRGGYGHVTTAAASGFYHRYAGNEFETRRGYGHVTTGFGQVDHARRYAFERRRVFGYGGYDAGSGGDAGGGAVYASGGAGGVYTTGGDAAPYATGAQGGYAAGPSTGFAEPPLNTIGYGGGPQIIVVGGGSHPQGGVSCSCGRQNTSGPVVYRFGVGSYY